MSQKLKDINFANDINITESLQLLWNKKSFILLVSLAFMILSLLYSLSIPNKYISRTLLAPLESKSSLPSMGSLAPLAAIAGANIPNGNSTKTSEAIQIIKTYDFFTEYFLSDINLEDLLAVEAWDESKNKLIYDESVFNENLSVWVSKTDSTKPSPQAAYVKYLEIVKVTQDKDNNFVNLSIEHHSPFIAKDWVDLIVIKIDDRIRKYDKKKAKSYIDFLNETANSTSLQPLKDSISSLLENQMQILMLASANNEYVFKVLDSAVVSENKTSPNRLQIIILGTLFGLMLSISSVLLNFTYKKYKETITIVEET